MLFEKDEGLEPSQPRTKTLLISIGIHVLLLVFLALNPDLLTSTPKRIIKVMGQDYDLSKQEITELVMPPDSLRQKPPAPAQDKPLVQPPVPQQAPPPPPPPQQQPPPPPPQTPPPVIGPDDILKEGARPDAQAKASRGDTTEQARAGAQEQSKPEPPKQQQQPQAENRPPQLAQNTNPNALRVPNLRDSAERIVQQNIDEDRRRYPQGPRTGAPGGQEEPNFSTEEPTILSDTKGYDFGPYMNQVVNRVRYNWYSLIPESARLGKKGRVVITFMITHNGSVQDVQLRANSGADPLDRAALGAITASNPFAQLPQGFEGDHLVLQFTFLYNIR
jgi:TonB family protein